MEDEAASSQRQNDARLAILELTNMMSVPMCLIAVIRLKVADAIWQRGSNLPLSSSQILSHLAVNGSDAENLQRILRMLASYGVFEEVTEEEDGGVGEGIVRRYSLTDVGKMLVTDADGLSYGMYVLQHHQDELMRAWQLAHEAVLDPATDPFVKVNGELTFSYYGKRPEMNRLMQNAMSATSVPFMRAMLDGYNEFAGVERLVDVGGSAGDCLRMIMGRFPTVREGVNLDLPEVVAEATSIPGVTHVGGDMFKSIPSGDAIFMKRILTAWTNDECKLILENCYKALPADGKLIACEPVLPKYTDDIRRTRALLESDIFVMTTYRAKGKHRTEEEFRKLGAAAGFPKFRAIYVDHFYTVLEFLK